MTLLMPRTPDLVWSVRMSIILTGVVRLDQSHEGLAFGQRYSTS